jgi:hypothetical protein
MRITGIQRSAVLGTFHFHDRIPDRARPLPDARTVPTWRQVADGHTSLARPTELAEPLLILGRDCVEAIVIYAQLFLEQLRGPRVVGRRAGATRSRPPPEREVRRVDKPIGRS